MEACSSIQPDCTNKVGEALIASKMRCPARFESHRNNRVCLWDASEGKVTDVAYLDLVLDGWKGRQLSPKAPGMPQAGRGRVHACMQD